MFLRLEEIELNQNNYYGNKAIWLRRLIENNINVVKTIVVTQELFQLYILSNNLDENILQRLYDLIAKEFDNVSELFFKVSLFKENIGISDNQIVKNNAEDIKQNIEEIYHSWNENFARSHRITHGIEDKDTYPTLLIQIYEKNIFSLVTRCPQKGLPTDKSNLVNVHNHVDEFQQEHIKMLETTESILHFPTKVFFTQHLSICSVKPEFMCDYAYFVSLNDLLRKDYIDELIYLSKIEPHFISKVTSASYFPVDVEEEYYLQLQGVPASPGRAVGILSFNSEDTFEKFKNQHKICCFAIFRPDDVHYLMESIGAFSNEGGATSHLAVISRHFYIPSIVGISKLFIDTESRQVKYASKSFNEGCMVMIDGYTGTITISSKPFSIDSLSHYSAALDSDNLRQLYLLLKKHTEDFDSFKNLPVDLQIHMSKLTQRFKTINFS